MGLKIISCSLVLKGDKMNTLDHEQMEKLCRMYGKIKYFMIKAEEFGLKHKTYLQPRLELFQAFDHMVGECFLEQLDNKAGSLNGTMKHMYTAFFDIADWTINEIRRLVFMDLEHYSPDVIKTAIPEYYSEIRPAFDEFANKIIKIREGKTFEKFEYVDEYVLLLDKAYEYINKIRCSQSTLIDLKKKYRIKTMLGPVIGLLAIIVSIIIAFLR
jgi:hypothetical protein